ncbi:NUDIX domain-containing protein [Henriciella sp.]|uniref:NUDIX hydrolase n=1 Tax=Henriciella sp. TaxID=1968823 RepID=UPI00262463A1|nr:NUDIX domain-containing protein [Henriciella sp.]
MAVKLGSAYDKEDDGDIIQKDRPTPRPRDAATLILVRRDQAEPRLLMGKRSGRHDFMPDKYVFPGGRVDTADGRVPSLSELRQTVEQKLAHKTRRKPRAFGLTAIRETFEETGLIVGRASDFPGRPAVDWLKYAEQRAAPCLKGFTFIGRAITPPYRPKRFDARFFMAEAEDVLIDERPPVDGAELHDLQWVTLSDAMNLDLPNVTRFMIGEIGERLEKNDPEALRPPFLRWTPGGHSRDRI